MCVVCSGRETGDVGGGAKETDEPPEQHGGENRQVSSVLFGLNLTFLLSFLLHEIKIKSYGFY